MTQQTHNMNFNTQRYMLDGTTANVTHNTQPTTLTTHRCIPVSRIFEMNLPRNSRVVMSRRSTRKRQAPATYVDVEPEDSDYEIVKKSSSKKSKPKAAAKEVKATVRKAKALLKPKVM
jgi:hypothetical protein